MARHVDITSTPSVRAASSAGPDTGEPQHGQSPDAGWMDRVRERAGEASLRLASPLFYLATSLVVYAIADELYGKETAFWSALTFALLTGVSFSTRIISTDVPLLFFWALALFAYLKLLAGPDWR